MEIPFTVGELIRLAKIGSDTLVAGFHKTGTANWKGLLPGSKSETFDDIESALRNRFPDGVIVCDIA